MKELPMYRLCFVALTFATIAIFARAEHLDDKKNSAKVEGVFVIPKEVASFDGRLVEIRLYQYDPRIAGKAADLVEKVEFRDFSHTAGKETKKEFVIGAKADVDPKRSYYVTFFILEKEKRTHMGKCDHDKDGIGKVLTNGQPKIVSIKVAEIKR